MNAQISAQAHALLEKATAYRREFHRWCEPGWLEMRTASRVAGILQDLGYEVLLGEEVLNASARLGLPEEDAFAWQYRWAKENGADPRFLERVKDGFSAVVGVLRCGEGKTVALRFDMDALYVQEEASDAHRPFAEGFSSCVPGVMHACGHDGHTAIGLCVAELLMKNREKLRGTVKLIFQPAEEGVRGAYAMAQSGALDDVDAIFAAHVYPKEESSEDALGIFSGEYGAVATTKFDAVFCGAAAHAGMFPEEGRNALLAAAGAALNLAAISRRGDCATQVNVGSLIAKGQRNVICERAKLELEVRGQTTTANEYMQRRAKEVLQGAAQMYGCEVNVTQVGHADALKNSPELTEFARLLCRELSLKTRDVRGFGSGSEDFACLAERVAARGGKSLYVHLLTSCAAVNHSSHFDFDEAALERGICFFAGSVFSLLGGAENAAI